MVALKSSSPELITFQVEYCKSQDRLKRYEEHVRSRRRAKSKEAAGEWGAEAEKGAVDPPSSSASRHNQSDFEPKLELELNKTKQQVKPYEVGGEFGPSTLTLVEKCWMDVRC